MVYQVLNPLASGEIIAEIILDDYFPALNTEDVLACVAYANAWKPM